MITSYPEISFGASAAKAALICLFLRLRATAFLITLLDTTTPNRFVGNLFGTLLIKKKVVRSVLPRLYTCWKSWPLRSRCGAGNIFIFYLAKRARFLARRRLRTCGDFFWRALKPCFFFFFLLLGWNVLLGIYKILKADSAYQSPLNTSSNSQYIHTLWTSLF